MLYQFFNEQSLLADLARECLDLNLYATKHQMQDLAIFLIPNLSQASQFSIEGIYLTNCNNDLILKKELQDFAQAFKTNRPLNEFNLSRLLSRYLLVSKLLLTLLPMMSIEAKAGRFNRRPDPDDRDDCAKYCKPGKPAQPQ